MLSSTSKLTNRCTSNILQLNLSQSGYPATFASDLILVRQFSLSRQIATPVSSASSIKSSQGQPSLISNASKPKWDLFTGVVLERKPLITQEMMPIEKEYVDLLSKYEVELSKKSDHEIRKEKDAKIIAKIKAGEIEADQASSLTAQDEEDIWAAEFQKFTPASRQTEADKKNDQKSLNRALDSHLLLVIEQKLGKDYKWVCPHGKWKDGETLRQTAERTLKELCPEVKAKVLGNAPWGFYKYRYPKKTISSMTSEENPPIGAKVFFYKAQIVSGDVQLSSKSKNSSKTNEMTIEMKDYLWLRRSELESKLLPEYYRNVAEILIDEKN